MTHPRPRRLQVLPGFGLSLGMSLLFVALILLLPLSGLALNLAQLSFADYWNIVAVQRPLWPAARLGADPLPLPRSRLH